MDTGCLIPNAKLHFFAGKQKRRSNKSIPEFNRKVRGLREELPVRLVDVNPNFAQQCGAFLIETALGLDG